MGAYIGLALGVGSTLLSAHVQGKQQQEQLRLQAEQEKQQAAIQAANEQIALNNAKQKQAQAKEQSKLEVQNNELADMQRRRVAAAQAANRGASGVANSGSAAALQDESVFNMYMDRATDVYNSRQKIEAIRGEGVDYENQANQYEWQKNMYLTNASNYNRAAKQVHRNAMTGAILGLVGDIGWSMAKGNYSSKSEGGKVVTPSSGSNRATVGWKEPWSFSNEYVGFGKKR